MLNLLLDQLNNFICFAAILFDSIWYFRNQIFHHGGELDISALLRLIHKRYFEIIAAWQELAPHPAPIWHSPPVNSWKINFDVAIRKTFSLAATVCRDSEGHVLFV